MKKFKTENLILIVALILLGSGGLFYLKKDQLPLYLIALSQKKTKENVNGQWVLEAVVDEESYTVKNLKSETKKEYRIQLETLATNELKVTDLSLGKSYQEKIKKGKNLLTGKEFLALEKTIDALAKSYSNETLPDFNAGLFLDSPKGLSFLTLNPAKNKLFWYEGEELQIFEKKR